MKRWRTDRNPQVRVALFDRVSARVHQVGLAEADAAVQVKRVVSFPGRFSDG